MAKAPKSKDVHVDLLEIDMETGTHWLHPGQMFESDPKLKAIRKKHRDKHIAKQNAKKSK